MTGNPATLEVWTDSISVPVPCGFRACQRRIVWAELVASGKKMPFEAHTVALPGGRVEYGREVSVLAWDDNHWRACPGAEEYRRRPAPAQQNAREREATKRRENPTLGGLFSED